MIILPGTKGLFSPNNKTLKEDPLVIGLGKISKVREELLDISAMVILLATCPKYVKDVLRSHYNSSTFNDFSEVTI